ncbi:hypothetical protein M0R45_001845 [Rubus argutus]|uniref:Uncharacterized protein n=1 Tax=Rubus argutus TaxID=59490 RepID=A0AAW1VEH8_RUBAR
MGAETAALKGRGDLVTPWVMGCGLRSWRLRIGGEKDRVRAGLQGDAVFAWLDSVIFLLQSRAPSIQPPQLFTIKNAVALKSWPRDSLPPQSSSTEHHRLLYPVSQAALPLFSEQPCHHLCPVLSAPPALQRKGKKRNQKEEKR